MPNRIVRDGLLDSEAVLSLPAEGRWLYVAILLTADDYGLFEATTFKLAKRADIKREHVPALLQSMADVDLVRLYQPEAGVRLFGFMPKFGQRMRGYRPKHPLPPLSLVLDDGPLLRKIKDLTTEKTDRGLTTVRPRSDHGRPETEAETETESETLNTTPPSNEGGAPTAEAVRPESAAVVSGCPHRELLALWAAVLPELTQHDPDHWCGARADHLRARWREMAVRDHWQSTEDGITYFRRLFRYVRGSAFLMGRTLPSRPDKRPFRLTLEWLAKPGNLAKVTEGQYHDEAMP